VHPTSNNPNIKPINLLDVKMIKYKYFDQCHKLRRYAAKQLNIFTNIHKKSYLQQQICECRNAHTCKTQMAVEMMSLLFPNTNENVGSWFYGMLFVICSGRAEKLEPQ
jgi:hypothetical protein